MTRAPAGMLSEPGKQDRAGRDLEKSSSHWCAEGWAHRQLPADGSPDGAKSLPGMHCCPEACDRRPVSYTKTSHCLCSPRENFLILRP